MFTGRTYTAGVCRNILKKKKSARFYSLSISELSGSRSVLRQDIHPSLERADVLPVVPLLPAHLHRKSHAGVVPAAMESIRLQIAHPARHASKHTYKGHFSLGSMCAPRGRSTTRSTRSERFGSLKNGDQGERNKCNKEPPTHTRRIHPRACMRTSCSQDLH